MTIIIFQTLDTYPEMATLDFSIFFGRQWQNVIYENSNSLLNIMLNFD